jgi:hypothetical protein
VIDLRHTNHTVAYIDHQNRTHLRFVLRIFYDQIIFQHKIETPLLICALRNSPSEMRSTITKMKFSKFSMLITITGMLGL